MREQQKAELQYLKKKAEKLPKLNEMEDSLHLPRHKMMDSDRMKYF